MVNETYWTKRAESLTNMINKDITTYTKQMREKFADYVQDIEKEIASFLTKYADETGLTFAEASKNLTRIEKADYIKQRTKLLAEYKETGSKEIKARIKELEARATRTRLDALRDLIDARLYIMTEELNIDTGTYLEGVYEKAYMQTGQDVAKGLEEEDKHSAGFLIPLALLLFPYSGLTYNERMWKCTDKLRLTIREMVQAGLTQGKTISQITKDVNSKLKQKGIRGYSNYDLERVIKTETSYLQEQGAADARKKYGVEKYRIVCVLDERTCRRCGSRHGEEYLESERTPAVNAPPFHPLCRCTTEAFVEEDEE